MNVSVNFYESVRVNADTSPPTLVSRLSNTRRLILALITFHTCGLRFNWRGCSRYISVTLRDLQK